MEKRRGARKKPTVKDLNAHLVCILCGGYFIDAHTLVECLHSFCRTCILRHLDSSKFCPICDLQVNLSKSSECVRADTTLQSLVYKIVPTVYQNELHRRKEFYAQAPLKQMAPSTPNYGLGSEYFSPEDSISLSLQYYTDQDEELEDAETTNSEATDKLIPHRRYLQCPAAVSMKHLKKFIRLKYGLSCDHLVDMIYSKECLPDDFTLMDVAYTFSWKRTSPMRFHYRIFQKPTFRRSVLPISHTVKKHDSKSVTSKSVNNNCGSSPTENSVPSHEHTIGTMSEESPSKKLRMSCESSEEVSCTTTSVEVALKAVPPTIEEQTDIKQELEKVCVDNKHCEATPKTLSLKIQEKCINVSEDERSSVKSDVKEDISKVESTVTSSGCETIAPEKKEKTTQETKKHAEKVDKKVEVDVEVDKVKNNLKRRASSEDEGSSRSNEHEKKHKEEKEHSGRKKGKHKYKYFKSLDDKKRSIIVTPTILHNPDDVMKLKVKLNPVPVIPNSHHHKHHHHSKHHHSKHHKSSSDSSSNANVAFSTNKERLLQMRAVRHKTNKQGRAEKSPEEIFQKQKASLLVPPSSITVSKVPSSDKRTSDLNKLSGGSNGIENKRPSLEIMLVSSKKSSSSSVVQGKSDDGKKTGSESGTKAVRPLPASIPLVRTSKQSMTPIKPPLGLTITPKITPKHDDTSSKPHSAPTKAAASSAKGKKYTDSVTSSKVQDIKFQEKSSSPKLPEGTVKLPENGCKERGIGPGPASMRHDNFGALDLSGKSSRKSDSSSPIPIPEVVPVPSGGMKSNPSILAIAQNLVHKQLSSGQGLSGDSATHGSSGTATTGTNNATPSSGMSNLKTLSDAAVRIRNLMAAETKGPSPTSTTVATTNNHNNTNNNGNGNCSPTRNSLQFNNNNNLKASPVKVQSASPYPAGSTLRIPVPQATLKYPTGRGLSNRPSIPRLNEIVSRGRGGRGVVPLASTKPGPNLGVRHIPNPSALFRQQSINKNINGKGVTSSTASEKPAFNGTGPIPSQSPTSMGSSLTVTAAPIRKIENMTRNIEKVAAGLSVRAVEANGASKLT